MINVKVKILDHFDSKLGLPQYQSAGAAGADLKASFSNRTCLELAPGERVLIPTGLSFEIPKGLEIQVRPRSGLSLKTGLIIPNAPGTIDSDYRGEVKVILANIGNKTEVIRHGDRIAQLVLAKVDQISFETTTNLSETRRDSAGFGSTGVNS